MTTTSHVATVYAFENKFGGYSGAIRNEATREVPTVHMNGTSRDELLSQHIKAIQAVHGAIGALQRAAPNGRDYYPQGDSAIRTVSQI